MAMNTGGAANLGEQPGVTLAARAERRLVRQDPSFRHVVYTVQVAPVPPGTASRRTPLALALVLDRSGSMSGAKITTAKQAALRVINRLGPDDRAAVVIFDSDVEVLAEAEAATDAFKERVRAALAGVDARASTALHEGWLTGCNSIVDVATDGSGRLARCLLLTDGLANIGVQDPEQIASEAAGVRARTGIGTSTFGIGPDYDEGLLGPMATAGGGQFHHLRTPEEIDRTFGGELGELFSVRARQVRLELAADAGVMPEIVSDYWMQPAGEQAWAVTVGDLLAGEERPIVIRYAFPRYHQHDGCGVRARLVWTDDAGVHRGPWQELRFLYADHQACDAEERDPAAMHWVGLHHAWRAQRAAATLNRLGNYDAARQLVQAVARRIREYAGHDPELLAVIDELTRVEHMVAAPMAPMLRKETLYQSARASRFQRDFRE